MSSGEIPELCPVVFDGLAPKAEPPKEIPVV